MSTKENGILESSSTPGSDTHPPKFGVVIPNRIFVGGIPSQTQEADLYKYFSDHGIVKDVKIIHDRAGVSKGYGFVTFDSDDDVKKIQQLESLLFRERKLNVGPAIRKQQPNPKLHSDSYGNGISNNGPHSTIGTFFYPQGLNVSHLFYGPASPVHGTNNGVSSFPSSPTTPSNNINASNPLAALNALNVNGYNIPVVPSNNSPSLMISPNLPLYPQYIQPEYLTYANMNSAGSFLVSPAPSNNVMNPALPSIQGNHVNGNSNQAINRVGGVTPQLSVPVFYSAQPLYYPSYPVQTNVQTPGTSPVSPSSGSNGSASSVHPKWGSIVQPGASHFIYTNPEYIYQMNQAINNGGMGHLSHYTHSQTPANNFQHYTPLNTFYSQHSSSSLATTSNVPPSFSSHNAYKENDAYTYQKTTNIQHSLLTPNILNGHASSIPNYSTTPLSSFHGSHIEGIKD